jgi:pimeloyl-ACP methyl ester carboxylesterase
MNVGNNNPALNVESVVDDALAAGAIPLCMLHGWGRSLGDMRGLAELLKETAQPLLIDLPGFGGSAAPPKLADGQSWGSYEYANRLLQYLDQRGIEQTDLLGHSFGGRVSIAFAAANPERVRRLILINSAGLIVTLSPAKALRRQIIRRTGKLVRKIDSTFNTDLFEKKFSPRFGSRDYQKAGELRGVLVRTVNEDLTADLRRIKNETLLIWGALDTETPIVSGRRMAAAVPNSGLIVLDNGGHHVFEGVASHLLASYIRPFLGGGLAQLRNQYGGRYSEHNRPVQVGAFQLP